MIHYSAILDEDEALKAVQQDGDALRYVREQSEAVCLEAVKQKCYALRYVLDCALFERIAAQLGIETEGLPSR